VDRLMEQLIIKEICELWEENRNKGDKALKDAY